ncbi:MAG TPA: MAPEG family protein [Gammaproteobacteria bacterium]|nr:MAPEG family protein [Gammaproteobacteria bacterium]
MSAEIFWLALTAIATGLMFLPYVLNRIQVRGLFGAMSNPRADDLPESEWAQRAMRAHGNAVENLVVFTALIVAVEASGANSGLTAFAAALFFWARLAHYLIYTAGIPIARTLAFGIGLLAEILLVLGLLGD